MNVKDKREVTDKSGVVYSIPCHNCNDKYIGETSRSLGTRMIEHRRDIDNGK